MTPAERTAKIAELRAEADRLEREGKIDALLVLRDEVAKMAWPPGAAYCARLIEALNATLNKQYSLDATIKTPDEEPTGAELVGKVCQLSLLPINTNRDGIRDTVVMYDAQRDEYHGAGGQSKPWKYARIYRGGRP